MSVDYRLRDETHYYIGGRRGERDHGRCVRIANFVFLKESRLVGLKVNCGRDQIVEPKIPILVSKLRALIHLNQCKRDTGAGGRVHDCPRKDIPSWRLLLQSAHELGAQNYRTRNNKEGREQYAVQARHRGSRVPHAQ